MSGSVLVPSSPTKAQAPVDPATAWPAYSHVVSSSKFPVVHQPLTPNLSFLASSANANRTAFQRRKLPSRSQAFRRDGRASFGDKASKIKSRPHLPITKRDDSFRLIENLTPGPKKVTASEDDLHFNKMEPTSGIALRHRIFPHAHLEAHLEGRYYIPISTLYSVAQENKCDDGDYSIPVEGDWITMGVLVKKGAIALIKEKSYDAMGRLQDDDYKKAFGQSMSDKGEGEGPEKRKEEIVTGKGQTKTVGPRRFYTLTLLDISNAPNKYGEHSGDNEIEVSVFESNSTWVEPGGERRYAGGSCGAFEKLEHQPLGSLICILNPRIKKVKRWFSYADQKQKHNGFFHEKQPTSARKEREQSTHLFRLNPRTGKTIEVIGMARDYEKCSHKTDLNECEEFVDRRSERPNCVVHSMHRFEKKETFKRGPDSRAPINEYSLSNGMAMGSKAKRYTMEGDVSNLAKEGGLLYDISAHYGRSKENESLKLDKIDKMLDLRDNLKKKMGRTGSSARVAESNELLSESRMANMARQKHASRLEAMSKLGTSKSVLDNVIFDSAGSKIIEAARLAIEQKKNQNKNLHSQGIKRKTVLRDDSILQEDSKSNVKKESGSSSSSSSSKLLARRSISSASLPKPMLRNKKVKLPPTVRPPPGQSFYASESSDEELDEIMRGQDMEQHLEQLTKAKSSSLSLGLSDSDSDLEIIPC